MGCPWPKQGLNHYTICLSLQFQKSSFSDCWVAVNISEHLQRKHFLNYSFAFGVAHLFRVHYHQVVFKEAVSPTWMGLRMYLFIQRTCRKRTYWHLVLRPLPLSVLLLVTEMGKNLHQWRWKLPTGLVFKSLQQQRERPGGEHWLLSNRFWHLASSSTRTVKKKPFVLT